MFSLSCLKDINGGGTLSSESELTPVLYTPSCLLVIDIVTCLQAYDDYLDDVLSLDLAAEPVSEKSLHSTNMLDFLVKEEPLGEDDLKALQKDRQKKDNHNMSKNMLYLSVQSRLLFTTRLKQCNFMSF